MIKILC